MAYKSGKIVYKNDGSAILVEKDGKKLYPKDYSQPGVPFVSGGLFANGRSRRISGLARFPGDKRAICHSMAEVEAKALEQGDKVGRVDDLYYDNHPVEET